MNAQPSQIVSWTVLLFALCACVGSGATVGHSATTARPALPREYVDTSLKPSPGRTWTVPANGDFQAILDEAQLGDEIVLAAGVQYQGPFMLPNKRQGSGWIIIRSSGVDKDFPPPGSRVAPAHAAKMATLVSKHSSVIFAERGAHHFRFIGIEMKPNQDTFVRDLMLLGDNTERSLDEVPHHIIVDRCFVHGDPKKGARRGVVVNGQHMAVIDSHLSDFKETTQDTQAVAGWGGTGFIKIVNNYLEATGENILFGGGERSIGQHVPSDIEVRRNQAAKPLAWKPGEPESDGTPYQVKILFELKNARRILVDGNIFEYNWQRPGYGFAVNLTVRNEVGTTPWAVIEDLTFTNNIVRHSPSGVNIMGNDDHYPSGRAQRITISNNIFDDINGERWGGKGRLFQLTRGTKDVVIEHNIGFHSGHIVMASGDPQEGFVYRYNITPHNEYGMEGEGTGVGRPTFERHFPDGVIAHNVMIGGSFYAERYSDDNAFPASVEALPFINAAAGDYRLTASNTWSASSTHEAPGIDAKALCAALGDLGRRESVCAKPVSKERGPAAQATKTE
jgi:hypothetical protein